MAARHKLTAEKKNIIADLIEMSDIKTMSDIQDALKDLLGGTTQQMLGSELDEELGYGKHEKTEEQKINYRNGHKPKTCWKTQHADN